jgi:alpha-ketoglutarate-dependent sulfate ester dioxygenase
MSALAEIAAVDAALDIRPITPRIGAEIHGIRLSGQLPDITIQQIREAIFAHKVVFFRAQNHLDDAGQEAFAKRLGTVVPHPTAPSADGTEYVLDIDGTRNRASAWHTDVTFIDTFPQFSILRGAVIPPLGGDTVWANTAAAYQDLSPALREHTDQLWALYTNDYDYAGTRPGATAERVRYHQEVILSTIYETEHPVVQIHPETGEPALILGNHVRKILGYNAVGSAQLFNLLQSYIEQLENTVRWRWSTGDVAIWDNRATQHRAIDDYGTQERVVRRVTVAGPVPVGVDGRLSVTRRKIPADATAD